MARILSLCLVLGLCACSSSGNSPSDGPTNDAGNNKDTAATTDSDGTGDSSPAACDPPSDMPAGTVFVKHVTGKVLDTEGKPVPADKPISVCGITCFFGKTDATGTYSTKICSPIKVADYAASVHGRPDYASVYVKLPAGSSGEIALPDMIVPKLPATGTKLALDADHKKFTMDQTIDSGAGITFKFQNGTGVELDVEDFLYIDMDPKNGDQLRAVKVDEAHYPPFAKEAGLKAVYVLSPFDSKYDKKVEVTITGTGLPDGPVEFVVLGNQFLSAPLTAGTPQVEATGTVTGGTAKTNTGEGLSTLTWVGIRPKS